MRNMLHLFYAWWGAVKYGHPSDELLVIGVTGTSGKSTTVYFLCQLLEAAGYTVGALSTIEFYVAGKSKLNDRKMTMLGKMEIQRYLREMLDAGCDVAIIETTSEGAVQHRHRFINYDTIVLTNLYPEHIESHGSFEKYKAAKLGIFEFVAKSRRKILDGKKIKKTAIVNKEVKERGEFLRYPFDERHQFGAKSNVEAKDIVADNAGLRFRIYEREFHASLYGRHNVTNILAVVAVARSLGISWDAIQEAVSRFRGAPGRIEFIKEAEQHGFQVIVDYAFEPVALGALYDVVALIQPKRVIHVCGSTGGGRDKARRKLIGKIAGEKADIVMVTNEDPYDEDPMAIIHDVSAGAQEAGKKLGENLFEILDRKEAIAKAISLAEAGDLVLVTGKGSEQGIMIAGGKMVEWDDRVAVLACLLSQQK